MELVSGAILWAMSYIAFVRTRSCEYLCGQTAEVEIDWASRLQQDFAFTYSTSKVPIYQDPTSTIPATVTTTVASAQRHYLIPFDAFIWISLIIAVALLWFTCGYVVGRNAHVLAARTRKASSSNRTAHIPVKSDDLLKPCLRDQMLIDNEHLRSRLKKSHAETASLRIQVDAQIEQSATTAVHHYQQVTDLNDQVYEIQQQKALLEEDNLKLKANSSVGSTSGTSDHSYLANFLNARISLLEQQNRQLQDESLQFKTDLTERENAMTTASADLDNFKASMIKLADENSRLKSRLEELEAYAEELSRTHSPASNTSFDTTLVDSPDRVTKAITTAKATDDKTDWDSLEPFNWEEPACTTTATATATAAVISPNRPKDTTNRFELLAALEDSDVSADEADEREPPHELTGDANTNDQDTNVERLPALAATSSSTTRALTNSNNNDDNTWEIKRKRRSHRSTAQQKPLLQRNPAPLVGGATTRDVLPWIDPTARRLTEYKLDEVCGGSVTVRMPGSPSKIVTVGEGAREQEEKEDVQHARTAENEAEIVEKDNVVTDMKEGMQASKWAN